MSLLALKQLLKVAAAPAKVPRDWSKVEFGHNFSTSVAKAPIGAVPKPSPIVAQNTQLYDQRNKQVADLRNSVAQTSQSMTQNRGQHASEMAQMNGRLDRVQAITEAPKGQRLGMPVGNDRSIQNLGEQARQLAIKPQPKARTVSQLERAYSAGGNANRWSNQATNGLVDMAGTSDQAANQGWLQNAQARRGQGRAQLPPYSIHDRHLSTQTGISPEWLGRYGKQNRPDLYQGNWQQALQNYKAHQ